MDEYNRQLIERIRGEVIQPAIERFVSDLETGLERVVSQSEFVVGETLTREESFEKLGYNAPVGPGQYGDIIIEEDGIVYFERADQDRPSVLMARSRSIAKERFSFLLANEDKRISGSDFARIYDMNDPFHFFWGLRNQLGSSKVFKLEYSKKEDYVMLTRR